MRSSECVKFTLHDLVHQITSILTFLRNPHTLRDTFLLSHKAVIVAAAATVREVTTLFQVVVEVPRQYLVIAMSAIHFQTAYLCTFRRKNKYVSLVY